MYLKAAPLHFNELLLSEEKMKAILKMDTVQTAGHSRDMSFFPRTIPEWNSLPQEIVAAKSLDCFKTRLAAHL